MKGEGLKLRDMTPEELEVVQLLGEAFNKHQRLPMVHKSDTPEFAQAVHVAQNIVYARPAFQAANAPVPAPMATHGSESGLAGLRDEVDAESDPLG